MKYIYLFGELSLMLNIVALMLDPTAFCFIPTKPIYIGVDPVRDVPDNGVAGGRHRHGKLVRKGRGSIIFA